MFNTNLFCCKLKVWRMLCYLLRAICNPFPISNIISWPCIFAMTGNSFSTCPLAGGLFSPHYRSWRVLHLRFSCQLLLVVESNDTPMGFFGFHAASARNSQISNSLFLARGQQRNLLMNTCTFFRYSLSSSDYSRTVLLLARGFRRCEY